MTDITAHVTQLGLLAEADNRLVRTVDALDDATYRQASLLPDWTVGHVIAHLALNGEGLAGALHGVATGVPTPMYACQEARDDDIATLGVAAPSELRSRLMASTELFDREVADLPDDKWETTIERTPGNRAFKARSTVLMRIREVEIHHADLGVGYTSADWSPAFCTLLLDSLRAFSSPVPFRVLARDLAQTWEYGEGEPTATVAGDAHALAWWLTGRGTGETLTSDTGTLPEVSAW
ncbi:maleylpyruvate isomerase family mycothiol-dependent enzyme [Nocardioides currus]|nr:maleylpyruvate isomerase family mycothiol-dependent enzyme [Nocardioides currus]